MTHYTINFNKKTKKSRAMKKKDSDLLKLEDP